MRPRTRSCGQSRADSALGLDPHSELHPAASERYELTFDLSDALASLLDPEATHGSLCLAHRPKPTTNAATPPQGAQDGAFAGFGCLPRPNTPYLASLCPALPAMS